MGRAGPDKSRPFIIFHSAVQWERMKPAIFEIAKVLPVAILSAILMALAFPDANLWYLAWFGLAPLFLALLGRGVFASFFISYLYGICFLLITFRWILFLSAYSYLHHFLLALYLGFYFALFGAAFVFIENKWRAEAALFSAPFLWVSLEYIRSNFSFLALPWMLLSHSQYLNIPVLQVSEFTGAWGVSFLIVSVNSALAFLFVLARSPFIRGVSTGQAFPHKRAGLMMSIISFLLLFSALLYGHVCMQQPLAGNTLKISVVQGNVPPGNVAGLDYISKVALPLCELSKQSAPENPFLVVWPENSLPRRPRSDFRLIRLLGETMEATGGSLLLGSSAHQKFGRDMNKEQFRTYNSAFLLQAKGRPQRYDKMILLPFGEYLPFREIIPWGAIGVPDIHEETPGKEIRIFELPQARFATTICWENIFPDYVSRFVRNGAEFIINITNEHWFGREGAPAQFVSMSVMRAVENRIYIVRCANTGISCFIDPFGRIVERLKDESGQETFVAGILTGQVVPRAGGTFYTKYGDWFVLVCFLVAGAFLITAWRRELWIRSDGTGQRQSS